MWSQVLGLISFVLTMVVEVRPIAHERLLLFEFAHTLVFFVGFMLVLFAAGAISLLNHSGVSLALSS